MNLLFPLLLLGLLMYMMVLRPQRRVKAQRAQLMNALSPGDEIVTIGGAHGRVAALDDLTVDVELAEGVVVRFDRRAVAMITHDVPADEEADATDPEPDDDETAAPEADAQTVHDPSR